MYGSEKEYTLYDELRDKCNPERFMEPYEKEKVELAIEIFSELDKDKQYRYNDEHFISLRNRAISELGIHISTQKLYDFLDKYLNPKVYSDIHPYDKDRVNKANEFYSRMQEVKDDIIALEQIQKDANSFIHDSTWKNKLDERDKKIKEVMKKEREEEEEREKMKDIGYRFSRFLNGIFDNDIIAMITTWSVFIIMSVFVLISTYSYSDISYNGSLFADFFDTFNLPGWAYLIIIILNILPAFMLACWIVCSVEDVSDCNIFWRDLLIFVFSLVVSIPLLPIIEIFVGTVAGRLMLWILYGLVWIIGLFI